MLLQAIQSVIALLLLMSVGFFLCGKPWFRETGPAIFSKYAVSVGVPCYMCYNVYTTVKSKEMLHSLLMALPVPMLGIVTALLCGIALTKMFSIDRKRCGVFINICGLSNTVFIGFPVITAVFGEAAIPLGMVYYMANTLTFWTFGVYILRKKKGVKTRFFSVSNVKKMLSPPLLGLFTGILLVLTGIHLPTFLLTPLTYLAHTASPLALIFIGCVLRSCDFKKLSLSKDMALLLGARFLLAPALMAVFLLLLPRGSAMAPVFLLLSTMPAMTQLGIMARELDSDYEFASVMIVISTAISMVILPIYAAVLSVLPAA